MAEGIVIDGRTYPLILRPGEIAVPVLGPKDHGISFRAGQGHNRVRSEEIRACVWHWTGGENEPERMAKVLKKRGYGVEFAISRIGVIYQFADPVVVDTADTGGFNGPTVGVEVVNYGYRRVSPRDWQLRQGNWLTIPKAGRDRPTYVATIHGVKRKFAGFYPVQKRAALLLARTLNRHLMIPPHVCVQPSALTQGELNEFTGHLGHLNVTKRKLDPGLDLLSYLAEHLAPEQFV